jgi:hypothetical protein
MTRNVIPACSRRARQVLALSSTFAAVALVVAACSLPMSAGADFKPGVSFAPYETFAWDDADELPTGDPRLDHNPFFTDRLHAAIERALLDRGIRFDETAPGLLVHHHATVRSRVEVFEADQDRGYDPTEYGTGSTVVQWEEGTFLIDIADMETKQVLWRGWARADVERALNDPDRMTAMVDEAVSLMFERFPTGVGALSAGRPDIR